MTVWSNVLFCYLHIGRLW